jgi:hypothetical protein
MSGKAVREGRAALQVLLSAAGLAVWAAHFGVIYMAAALSCERHWAAARVAGMPLVGWAILLATLAALLLLAGIAHRARRDVTHGPWTEGGEAEPRFTAWFALSTAAYSAVAVLFQAAPALVVPPCG